MPGFPCPPCSVWQIVNDGFRWFWELVKHRDGCDCQTETIPKIYLTVIDLDLHYEGRTAESLYIANSDVSVDFPNTVLTCQARLKVILSALFSPRDALAFPTGFQGITDIRCVAFICTSGVMRSTTGTGDVRAFASVIITPCTPIFFCTGFACFREPMSAVASICHFAPPNHWACPKQSLQERTRLPMRQGIHHSFPNSQSRVGISPT